MSATTKQPVKWAKTWQQLSHALGLDISPKSNKVTTQALNKSHPLVLEFIQSKFCPKKNPPQKGWVIEEVRPAFLRFDEDRRLKSAEAGTIQGGQPQGLFGGYVKTVEEIAEAFSVDVATASDWLSWPDFPRVQPGHGNQPSLGYKKSDIERWLKTANITASQSTKDAAEEAIYQLTEEQVNDKLKKFPPNYQKRLRGLYEKWQNPNSQVDKALTNREYDELVDCGIVIRPVAPAGQGSARGDARPTESGGGQPQGLSDDNQQFAGLYGGDGKLKDCESQKALAIRLAIHFQGRTSIDISEQQISRWKSQPDELPPGVPPPPVKLGNRIQTQLWADWFERYMLPHYPYARAQGSLPGTNLMTEGREAEARDRIFASKIREIEYNAKAGHYGPVEKFKLARLGALKIQHNKMRTRLENDNPRQRSDWLKLHLPADILMQFEEFDKGLERATIQAIENDYLSARADEPEKRIVREETLRLATNVRV